VPPGASAFAAPEHKFLDVAEWVGDCEPVPFGRPSGSSTCVALGARRRGGQYDLDHGGGDDGVRGRRGGGAKMGRPRAMRFTTPLGRVALTPERPICEVCGEQVGLTWLSVEDGRVFCAHHRETARCAWCGFPASLTVDGYRYCRTCQDRAIRAREQFGALSDLVRSSLAPRGCWPSTLVPVRQESRRGMAGTGQDVHELGRTEAEFSGRVLLRQQILIRRGLPREVCLFSLAHEYGHVLLNHNGQSNLSAVHTEGFCQYLGGVVLREQLGGDSPAMRRHQHELTRDGLYGDGLRIVTEAVKRNGEAAVIRAFLTGTTATLGLRAQVNPGVVGFGRP